MYSALLGALSAGVMEGAPSVANTGINSIKAKQTYGNSAQDLVTEALELNPNSTYAQKMQTKLDKGKNLSGTQLYTLVEANETANIQ